MADRILPTLNYPDIADCHGDVVVRLQECDVNTFLAQVLGIGIVSSGNDSLHLSATAGKAPWFSKMLQVLVALLFIIERKFFLLSRLFNILSHHLFVIAGDHHDLLFSC